MARPDSSADALRRLAAELRSEVSRLGRVLDDAPDALTAVDAETPRTLELYGAAALLDTFYTGVEKALLRVAKLLGGAPHGASWHRDLLHAAGLRIAKVRPAVLSRDAIEVLEPYLSFRHRFRNLYLFDLDPTLVRPLLAKLGTTGEVACEELLAFANTLEHSADELETPGAD